MPMSRKFLTESTGEKIVKIGQYLAKIWTKNDSLVFWATLYIGSCQSSADFRLRSAEQTMISGWWLTITYHRCLSPGYQTVNTGLIAHLHRVLKRHARAS